MSRYFAELTVPRRAAVHKVRAVHVENWNTATQTVEHSWPTKLLPVEVGCRRGWEAEGRSWPRLRYTSHVVQYSHYSSIYRAICLDFIPWSPVRQCNSIISSLVCLIWGCCNSGLSLGLVLLDHMSPESTGEVECETRILLFYVHGGGFNC